MPSLSAETASKFARIALGHVQREYPNKLDHVLDGEADAQGPRALHPIFYGSFDWHSCVHGYWTLATFWAVNISSNRPSTASASGMSGCRRRTVARVQ